MKVTAVIPQVSYNSRRTPSRGAWIERRLTSGGGWGKTSHPLAGCVD